MEGNFIGYDIARKCVYVQFVNAYITCVYRNKTLRRQCNTYLQEYSGRVRKLLDVLALSQERVILLRPFNSVGRRVLKLGGTPLMTRNPNTYLQEDGRRVRNLLDVLVLSQRLGSGHLLGPCNLSVEVGTSNRVFDGTHYEIAFRRRLKHLKRILLCKTSSLRH
jgi:hypothetical protein